MRIAAWSWCESRQYSSIVNIPDRGQGRRENLAVPGGAISDPAARCEGLNDSEGKPPRAEKGEEKKESNGSLMDPKEDPKADGIPKLSSNSWNCLC